MLVNVLAMLCLAASACGQRRYYSLEDMPDTNFDCRDKILGGYYADPEANCQMFHVCVKIPGQGVQDFRFLCPNETAFDQENQICADSGDIDCEAAGLYLENFDLYRLGSAPAKRPLFSSSKGTVVPLGPSTKSPILTNNINEEDEFYLQRSDTGDRRLHSKDLLRGSSSSNFFNNRNKGKDLDDEDDDDDGAAAAKSNANRPRPNGGAPRAKSQYNTQYRKPEPPAAQTPVPVPTENPNQLNDKKRTKIAVRKLARKRPEEEAEVKPSPQPNFSSFTTQVTQKYNFGGPESRPYNAVNRVQSTPSTVPPSPVTAPQRYQQQNPRSKNEQPSTPAFFEPGATPRSFPADQNAKEAAGAFLRQPIVAAGANFQNRQGGNFQQNRPATAAAAANQQNASPNYPQAQNAAQNRQNQAQGGNYQQGRAQAQGNFQSSRASAQPPPGGNINFQGPRAGGQTAAPNNNFQAPRTVSPAAPQNFQSPRSNQPSTPPSNNVQRTSQFPASNQPAGGNYQAPRTSSQPPSNANPRLGQQGNIYQSPPRPNQAAATVASGNFQAGRSGGSPPNYPADFTSIQAGSRQTTASLPPNARAQTINNGLSATRTTQARNYFARNGDDFDDGDKQEFLKTAPSNNLRPSDLNSFQSGYKSDAADKINASRSLPTTTVKYYTPTIVTTPKTPSTHSASDISSTARQSNFHSAPQAAGVADHNSYAPSAATRKAQPHFGSTPAARPQYQQPLASPSSTKATETKDAAYDYAYYDEGGSFSEYDSLDSLGETDFSRTSQRTKSRLI